MERQVIEGLPDDFGGTENIHKVARNMEFGQRLQKLVDPNNYLDCVSDKIANRDVYPVFYSNHNQHLNIAGMREVIQNLEFRPQDIYVAIAWSLVNGGQDERIVNFAKGLIPTLENDNIHLVPLARPYDISAMRAERQYDDAKKALRITRANIGMLEQSLGESAGLVVFPEATTAGAVKGKKGVRPGVGRAEGNFIKDIHAKALDLGRTVLHVPIGMEGTNRIVEPRQSNPHLRAKFEIAKQLFVDQLGIDANVIAPLAKIIVGEPFVIEDPNVFEVDEYNDYLMAIVASLLKESERGVFREEHMQELTVNTPKRILGLEY